MTATGDPIGEFSRWFESAKSAPGTGDATACALATVGADGSPSVRMVLLKAYDDRGFVFYTNYRSRKARDLGACPRAALCFYWEAIGQQVRVEGEVGRVSDDESDAYFASRGRFSQIGAWASKQSQPLASRAELVGRFAKLELRYATGAIPRPPFWGGYRVAPERFEFWSSKPHRLHDRTLFVRRAGGWRRERLYP